MVVSGGGFWSSWCSGWTHSVWLQTDIFDSFRELFVNNYRWLLLLSTVSVILIDQLPAASIAPSRGPWRSSRTDRSLFTRSRYTRSGPVPQNKTFECVTLDSKDLSYQVIDQKQWTDEWNNRCVNSSSSLAQFMLLRSLTVLDIDGSGEGSVPCSKALSIMWDVQFAGRHLTSETHDVKLWRIWIRQNKTQPSPVTVWGDPSDDCVSSTCSFMMEHVFTMTHNFGISFTVNELQIRALAQQARSRPSSVKERDIIHRSTSLPAYLIYWTLWHDLHISA